MPRASTKPDDLATITARRQALIAELASVDEALKSAAEAARDAGRPIFLAALERVKIAAMDKAEARTIAAALERLGGKAVAARLAAEQ